MVQIPALSNVQHGYYKRMKSSSRTRFLNKNKAQSMAHDLIQRETDVLSLARLCGKWYTRIRKLGKDVQNGGHIAICERAGHSGIGPHPIRCFRNLGRPT